eukprot:10512675-Heterocapsa_arctica.AAC.1
MGFRPGFQPYELIHSMRVAIEKAVERRNLLCCAKLDVAKALYYVSHPHLFAALQRAGVSDDLARVIAREYVMPLTSTFSFGSQTSPPISIVRGVKQGDPLSGFLFACTLDYVISLAKPSWDRLGL